MISNVQQLARFSSPASMPGKSGQPNTQKLHELFGVLHEINTENTDRVSSHLHNVEMLLRLRNTWHLTESQKENRTYLLNFLALYIQVGVYPRDYDLQFGEHFCYEDENGKICAVGFLLNRTGKGDLAKKLGANYLGLRNSEVRKSFHSWLDKFGITVAEISMIQPYFLLNREEKVLVDTPEMSPAFAGLREATQTRLGDYLAAAFVGASSGIVYDGGQRNPVSVAGEMPTNGKAITITAQPGRGQAIATIFELLRPSPTGNQQAKSKVRAFFIPSSLGEPVLALTFSKSF